MCEQNKKCAMCKPLEESLTMNERQLALLEMNKKRNILMSLALLVTCIAFTILFAVTGFQNYNVQKTILENQSRDMEAEKLILEELSATRADFLELLASIEVTETTTTTEVTQDTGEGSGNNIYQGGENATYNQGGQVDGETDSENNYDNEENIP